MTVLIAMRGSMQGKITVYGRPGHAACTQPHWKEGGAVNAITKAAKIINALDELTVEWSKDADKRHKYLDPDIVLPTEIKGGDYWERYPEKVEIGFSANFLGKDVNIKEIDDKIMAVAQTDAWMKQCPPEIEYSWVYGTEICEDEPIVRIAQDTLDDMGIDPQLTGWGTLSDAIHLVNQSNIPTVSIGTGQGNIHGIDEFCDIDQLIEVTKIIAVSTMRWCGYA
jgi:acetylornithine deacetylase